MNGGGWLGCCVGSSRVRCERLLTAKAEAHNFVQAKQIQ
jgi:hypothetical protein